MTDLALAQRGPIDVGEWECCDCEPHRRIKVLRPDRGGEAGRVEVRSRSASIPVESMWLTASASNTNHEVSVGAALIASRTRPLTYCALAKKSRSSSR